MNIIDILAPKHETLSHGNDSYIVCSMFTPNLSGKCAELLHSVKQFNLSYSIYEVPSIHSSISINGSASSPFHKPNFIRSMLEKFRKPILYIDIDCIFRHKPSLINDIVSGGYDLAIFNWLSNERNDSYYPIYGCNYTNNRYYIYRNGLFQRSESQLICSGATQYWSGTKSSLNLLNKWAEIVELNTNSADDECLDFAFNNNDKTIKLFNFPKTYARYGYWIFDAPIIDHPDIPNPTKRQSVKMSQSEKRFYDERCTAKQREYFIKPDLILDTLSNEIYQLQSNVRIKIGNNTMPTYIY